MIRTLQLHGYKINRFPDRGPVEIIDDSIGANDLYENPELDEAIASALAVKNVPVGAVIGIVPIAPQAGYGADIGSLNLMIFYRDDIRE